MDPEAARMHADLGNLRRDTISAPTVDAKGRPIREDPRAAQAVFDMDEERRRRIREDAPPGEQGTDKAIKLSAWNSAKIVETDGRDAGLANRFNGQGHRAQLAAKLAQHGGNDEGREAAESRYGEERQLYLQERAAAAAAATEQTHLVKRAHYKLIKDLNDLAKNTDTREVAGYLGFNKSHVWMYEEVLTAKSMVEKGQIEELNARYVAHPVLAHFGDAAKFYYGAKPESTEDTADPSPPSPEKNVVQLAEAENSPELAVTNTIAAETKATPAPAAGPHVPPGSSNQVPSTSIPVRDPASTTVNPLQQAPTTGGLGQLSAVFHDASGAFLGEKSWSTRLAANVTMNIKTIQSHVNVDKLVEDVQTFAQQLGRPAESPISQALRRAGEELTAYGRAMSDASSEGSQRIPGHGMWPEGYDADLSSGEEL
ncbi:hypothetical protein LTR48_003634 [Friedmanniomyces endolithicus]|uniref:Uncharacterized protein n=1 Tax=Rachicladosporium monterosium TaxID=1507873 RepID=A0ABR0L7S5_9PEZI|nr:hypothetical protein LTR48_003634 [Friedmanniomyces endolithicus]KAK5144817.1 hypothetical protein LTR32_003334 [Rachicladosporium monterosium]